MLKRIRLDPWRLVGGVFPILQWSRSYNVGTGCGDLIAGITIALTLIPQSIAYSSLAGLQPQYGLYASFAGSFVYALMGTCPQINIGPTALLSLLTFTYTNGKSADYAVLLCFLCGVVQMLAGIAQLGFLVDFVSLPVVSGFTSAAAITIASSQMKGLLGLKFPSESFRDTWAGLFIHIGETRLPDTLMSLGCCVVLMGMKALKGVEIREPEHEKGRVQVQRIRRALWFLGVARNAVVVLIAAAIAFFVHQDKNTPLILTGPITPGIPLPRVPPFHTEVDGEPVNAAQMLSHLGLGLLVVPLVGVIANIAITKAFTTGNQLAASQEILALGACNLVSAFFSSFPVNGSFSRSAVSDSSGVKTPAAGIITGIIVLLTLAVLTPYFYFIPKSALSSVIICAVLQMVDVQMVKKLWTSSRLDLIPLVGAFIFCLLLGIELGLVAGIAIDVLLLMYYHWRPPLDVKYVNQTDLPAHYAVHPVGCLHFAGAEKLRQKLNRLSSPKNDILLKHTSPVEAITVVPDSEPIRQPEEGRSAVNVPQPPNILVVYCGGLHRLDYTVLQSLKMLVDDWSGRVWWDGLRPSLKAQLSSVLTEPKFCDNPGDVARALAVAARGSVDCASGLVITNDTHL